MTREWTAVPRTLPPSPRHESRPIAIDPDLHGATEDDLDLDGYLTPTRRFLERAKGVLGVVLALALILPLGAGLFRVLVFDRAGDRVVEELAADDLDAALAESVLLVGGNACDGTGTVTGTAFAVQFDGRDLLITNRHVVDAVGAVGVRPLGGGPGPRVGSWRLSSTADVAVLELEDAAALPPTLPLAEDDPAAGDRVRTVGFPSGMPFTTAGQVDRVASGRVELDMRVDPGASGSPVVDRRGTVVAQVFGRTESGRGVGTAAGTLRRALDDLGAARSDCTTVAPAASG